MSWWDKAVKWVGDQACKVGLHDVRDWEYGYDSKSCKQTGRCRKCNEEQTRIKHDEGKPQFDCDCAEYWVCNRCDNTRNGLIKHIWGPWKYVDDGSCLRVRKCARYANHLEQSIDHIWGPPIQRTPGNCLTVQHCTRCPDGINSLGEQHHFLPVERDDLGHLIRRCSRCNHKELAG